MVLQQNQRVKLEYVKHENFNELTDMSLEG